MAPLSVIQSSCLLAQKQIMLLDVLVYTEHYEEFRRRNALSLQMLALFKNYKGRVKFHRGKFIVDKFKKFKHFDAYDLVEYQNDIGIEKSDITAMAALGLPAKLSEIIFDYVKKDASLVSTFKAFNVVNWSQLSINIIKILIIIYRWVVNGFSMLLMFELALELTSLILHTYLIIKIKPVLKQIEGVVDIVKMYCTQLADNNLEEAMSSFTELEQDLGVEQNYDPVPVSSGVWKAQLLEDMQQPGKQRKINTALFKWFEPDDLGEVSEPEPEEVVQTSEPIIVKNQAAPSVETWIRMAVGLVTTGLSIASFSGHASAEKFQRKFITGHKFAQCIKDSSSSVRDMVEALSSECFGYEISDNAAQIEVVRQHIDRLNELNSCSAFQFRSSTRKYYDFREAIREAENAYTRFSSGTVSAALRNAYQLLAGAIQTSRVKFTEVTTAMRTGATRPETLIYQIIGRRGAGKSYFMTKYLIPEVAKRLNLSPDIYSLEFSGQIYFPPYYGEHFAVMDEFLADKEEDQMLNYLAQIGGTNAFNMPGADLIYKVQPCALKALFLSSNNHRVNLLSKKTVNAEDAIYSRLRRIEIINVKQPASDYHSRDAIPHTEDYSEFQILAYRNPAQRTDDAKTLHKTALNETEVLTLKNHKTDPAELLTKEELVDVIANSIKDRLESYWQSQTVNEQETINNQMEVEGDLGWMGLWDDGIDYMVGLDDLRNHERNTDSQYESDYSEISEAEHLVPYWSSYDNDLKHRALCCLPYKEGYLYNKTEIKEYLEWLYDEEDPRTEEELCLNPVDYRPNTKWPRSFAYHGDYYGYVVVDFNYDIDLIKGFLEDQFKPILTPPLMNPDVPERFIMHTDILAEVMTSRDSVFSFDYLLNRIEYDQQLIRIWLMGHNQGSVEYQELFDTAIANWLSVADHIEQQAGEESENFVVHFTGEPGTGKSFATERMARELSNMFQLPVVEVYDGTLSSVPIHTPAIYVLHDMLTDEKQYSFFYDRVVKPSIILLSSNLKFATRRIHIPDPSLPYTPYGAIMRLVAYIRPHIILRGYNQVNQEPGFIRRIGIAGKLEHMGQRALTIEENTCHFETEPGFGFKYKNQDVSYDKIMQIVYDKFVHYSKLCKKTLVIQSTLPPEANTADVVINAKSIEDLMRVVNDPLECAYAYYKRNDNTRPVTIQLSDAVVSSSYPFNPTMFHIPSTDGDFEAVKNLALKSYAALRAGRPDATCYIDTPNLRIYCARNEIKYSTELLIPFFSHEFVKENNTDCLKVVTMVYDGVDTAEGDVWYIELQTLTTCLVNGFQFSEEVLPVRIVEYLIANRTTLLADKRVQYLKSSVQIRNISANMLRSEKVQHTVKWLSFMKSPWFIIISIFCVILATLGLIWGIVSLVKMVFGSASQTKNAVLHAGGMTFNIVEETREVNDVNFVLSLDTASGTTVAEAESEIGEESIKGALTAYVAYNYAKTYSLGEYTIIKHQSDYVTAPKRKGTGKEQAKQRAVHVVRTQGDPINNPNTSAIVNKIFQNQVVVRTEKGTTYGMILFNNVIGVPAHQVGASENFYVSRNVDGKIEQFRASLLAVDHGNDTALIYVKSPQWKNGKDIRKYMIMERQFMDLSNACLVRRNCPQSMTRDQSLMHNRIEFWSGMVSPCDVPIDLIADGVAMERPRTLTYERFEGTGFPTVAGDCGNFYISTDKFVGPHIFTGIHVAAGTKGRSYSTVWTQEYIEQLMNQAFRLHPKRKEDIQLQIQKFNEVKLPCKTLTPIVADEIITDYIEGLVIGEPENELWQGPNLTYFGKELQFKPSHIGKHDHFPTEFSELLESPNEKRLSVIDFKQLPNELSASLPVLNGKPSPLAQQISYFQDPAPNIDKFKDTFILAESMLQSFYMRVYPDKHRVLTDVEMVNGLCVNPRDPLFDCLDRVDLNTSPGHFFIHHHNITLKKPLFKPTKTQVITGKDIYQMGELLEQRYTMVEDLALNGTRLFSVTTNNLKRELVAGYKSRVFDTCCVTEVLLFRKYMGTIQATMMKNRFDGPCKVGTDCLTEYNSLYREMEKISPYGEAGDFKRWDKHLLSTSIQSVMRVWTNIFIKQHLHKLTDEEEKEMRNVFMVLTDLIVNTICSADGHIYCKTRGLGSGVSPTSHINCSVNDFMFFVIVINIITIYNSLRETQELKTVFPNARVRKENIPVTLEFITSVLKWGCYGDDKYTVIKQEYLDIFNFPSFQHFYRTIFGIEYDVPSKDGSIYEYCKLSQLEFLSRKFINDDGVIFPALKKKSITALLHWTTSNTIQQYEAQFRCILDEAILHDRGFYCQIVRDIRLACEFLSKKYKRTLEVYIQEYEVFRAYTRRQILACSRNADMAQEDAVDFILKSKNDQIVLQNFAERVTQRTDAKMTTFNVEQAMLYIFQKFTYDWDISKVKVLKALYNQPSIVYTKGRVEISLYFHASTEHDFSIYQSDMIRILNYVNINQEYEFKFVNCGINYRSIQHEAVPIVFAVLTSNMVITRNSHAGFSDTDQPLRNSRNPHLSDIVIFQMDSGINAARDDIQEGTYKKPDQASTLPIEKQHMPASVLDYSPWQVDMKERAHKPMQTLGNPIVIPITTAANTIVDIVSLGELSTMSRAMRAWAKVNSETNATIVYSYKFVTAMTIINELVVGFSVERKASYTIDELQLIEWVAVNPQEQTATIELKLAPVTDDRNMQNRYTFSETIANGTRVPTIVVMTRVPIQNSYLNDTVTINIIRQAHFRNDTGASSAFRATADDLSAGDLASTTLLDNGAFSNSTAILSDLLRLPPGRPLHISCDGGYAPAESLGKALSYLPSFPNTCTTSSVLNIHTASYNKILTGGSNYNLALSSANRNQYIPILTPFAQRTFTSAIGGYQPTTAGFTTSLATGFQSTSPDTGSRVVVGCLQACGITRPVQFIKLIELTDQNIPDNSYMSYHVYLPSVSSIVEDSAITTTNVLSFMSTRVSNILEVIYGDWRDQGWSVSASTIATDITDAPVIDAYVHYLNGYPIVSQQAINTDTSNRIFLETATPTLEGTVTLEDEVHKFHTIVRLSHPSEGQRIIAILCRADDDVVGRVTDSFNFTPSTTVRNALDLQLRYAFGTSDTVSSQWFGYSASIKLNDSMNYNAFSELDLALIPAIANYVSNTSVLTVDPDQSRLNFAYLLPTTLGETIASSQASTEIADPLFVQNWQQFLRSSNMLSDTEFVFFTLWNLLSTTALANCAYKYPENVFIIQNNPTTDGDRYKVYPKLTYGEVRIGNVQKFNSTINLPTTTLTNRWSNRVVADATSFYNGSKVSSVRMTNAKRITARRDHIIYQMEAAMVGAAGIGSAFGGIAQMLLSIFQSNAVNDRTQAYLLNQLEQISLQHENNKELLELKQRLQGLSSPHVQAMANSRALGSDFIYSQQFTPSTSQEAADATTTADPTYQQRLAKMTSATVPTESSETESESTDKNIPVEADVHAIMDETPKGASSGITQQAKPPIPPISTIPLESDLTNPYLGKKFFSVEKTKREPHVTLNASQQPINEAINPNWIKVGRR